MADLIIKPSTGSGNNLIIQGADTSPAITVSETGTTTFAEATTLSGATTCSTTLGVTGNTTLSGTANNLGTVTAGTLGASVVFNDAHKDIDCDADLWILTRTTIDYNSEQILAFDTEYKKGSNITHPTSGQNGQVTCAKAGWYLISYATHNNTTTDDANHWRIKVNNIDPWGSTKYIRSYLASGSELQYPPAGTVCVPVYVGAGQAVHLYGEGNMYGSSTDGMNYFMGVRLGA
jgi:hypothetical protein